MTLSLFTDSYDPLDPYYQPPLDRYSEAVRAEIERPFKISKPTIDKVSTAVFFILFVLTPLLAYGQLCNALGLLLVLPFMSKKRFQEVFIEEREKCWVVAQLPAVLYHFVLKALNPDAQIGFTHEPKPYDLPYDSSPQLFDSPNQTELDHQLNPLRLPLTHELAKSFFYFQDQQEFFVHHIVARVADLALRFMLTLENLSLSLLSPFVVAASFLTRGRFKVLNDFTYQALAAPINYDLFFTKTYLPQSR
jgi:hypothetical protein